MNNSYKIIFIFYAVLVVKETTNEKILIEKDIRKGIAILYILSV